MSRAFILLGLVLFAVQPHPPPARAVAITIDDLPGVSKVDRGIATFERFTTDLLAALRRHQIPAIGFVNEGGLHDGTGVDPRRVALLRQWLDAGMELGNHTFSHPDLHNTPLREFERDVVRGEDTIATLLAATGKRVRYFRHPFLHTGRTLEIRRELEAFLGERGYRVAPVTIDNYDYKFAAAYDYAPDAAAAQITDEYLAYMTRVVAYYEQQSTAITGREISQILLLHANRLNARMMDALAGMLKGRGYAFVTLDRALEDPAYKSADTFAGPGGITWLHRWALTQGTRGSIFAGEPEVPEWIESAARPR